MKYIIAMNVVHQQKMIIEAQNAEEALEIAELCMAEGQDHSQLESSDISFLHVEPREQWYVAPLDINGIFKQRVASLFREVSEVLTENLLEHSEINQQIIKFLEEGSDKYD